jgi:hypothetical protein
MNTKIAMAKYTHCTFFKAAESSAVLKKKTYEPSTGATIVSTPLKACEILIRISVYQGGPHTTQRYINSSFSRISTENLNTEYDLLVMYGFAAVSNEPNPFPRINIAAQKLPND